MTQPGQPSAPLLVVAFGGQVFGVDPASGQRVWAHSDEDHSQAYVARIITLGERVYAILGRSNGTELRVLDYLTGRLLARTPVPLATGRTFVYLEGRLYAAGNGAVVCFGLDGSMLWQDDFKGYGVGPVSLGIPGYWVQGDLT